MSSLFGPVPSRRLGRSLGVNNLPYKTCTYSCVYCQAGRTRRLAVERSRLSSVNELVEQVVQRLETLGKRGDSVDFVTIVPDGEPTLDENLGQLIQDLRRATAVCVAVITNGSLLWDARVRDELRGADLVSVKVDAAECGVWKRINRPHGRLDFDRIQDGIRRFAQEYPGRLVTETMLVKGVNDEPAHLRELADLLSHLRPEVVYLSLPLRAPAEAWVRPSEPRRVRRAESELRGRGLEVITLAELEQGPFAATDDLKREILSLTSVHPVTEEVLRELVWDAGGEWEVVEELLRERSLRRTVHLGRTFYSSAGGGSGEGSQGDGLAVG